MPILVSKLHSYSNAKRFLIAPSHAHFCFEVMNVYLIDLYQNPIPKVMPLHELKQVQLQERFRLMTHESIQLKTLVIGVYRWAIVLSLNGNAAIHRSVLKKCLEFEYDESS